MNDRQVAVGMCRSRNLLQPSGIYGTYTVSQCLGWRWSVQLCIKHACREAAILAYSAGIV